MSALGAILMLVLVAGQPTLAQQQIDPAAAVPGDAAAAAVPTATTDEPVDPAIELFVAKCASCHTVGKGERVGPDLANSHQRHARPWLESFIQTPSSMLNSDPEARTLLQTYKGVRMPDLGLDAAQVATLIDLVIRCSGEPCDLVGKFTPVTQATEADIARGLALFTGREEIASGAVPCVSCHTVGLLTGVPGGTLAKDLTHAFARLGDEGLDATLKNPTFNLMNRVFGDRPLSPEEAFALRAFLNEANRSPSEGASSWVVLLTAVLGSVLAMAVLNGFWRRRLLGVRAGVTASGAAARKGRAA